MEVVFRQVPCFPSNDASQSRHLHSFSQSRSVCPKQNSNRKSLIALASCDEFSDKSHIQYYDDSRMAILKDKKEMKKQLKLVKGLSKNLSSFYDMGFGLNLDNELDELVRGKMISEATEVLVGQLQKLKAEKIELKRRKKEEKAKKKAAKMMMNYKCKDNEESSSSSSSESECEKVRSSNVIVSHGETTTLLPSSLVGEAQVEKSINNNNKIEVCMGGKCKKSGAAVLLENIQKAVGNVVGEGEVAVVGCKCMGKCRDGPNVKVVNSSNNSVPLCMGMAMGVGLEDVDSIVNHYLFGQKNIMVVNPAPAPAPAL
ncbi:hypothetical protein L6452_18879 [Arctium lappa]|uniref:Uncharacterized protein n=1 Tax=Arctium lappa TaxID=4217 RepID=A0ACB9C7A1_ARCLA|nr:hypothetical protein L6452_18879 [Arctium lappa]